MKNYNQFLLTEARKKPIEEKWIALFDIIQYYSDNQYTIENIKRYLKNGADVNMRLTDSKTALMNSAAHGRYNVVRYLLKQPGIDINVKDQTGEMDAIKFASLIGATEIVKLLLLRPEIDVKADDVSKMNFIDELNVKIDKSFLCDYDLQKKILANGREDIIFLLDKYNLVHWKIKRDNPELFKAAGWGLIGESKKYYYSDFHKELSRGNFIEAQKMIDDGFDVNCKPSRFSNSSALIELSYNGNLEAVDFLLRQPNIDITAYDDDGNFIDQLRITGKLDNLSCFSYETEKKILENGREDIILFLDRYGLVDPKIKEENPDLFKAADWGLINY